MIHGWNIDTLVETIHIASGHSASTLDTPRAGSTDGMSNLEWMRARERDSEGWRPPKDAGDSGVKRHTDAILCLLPLESLDLLASGGMDGIVRLWDLRSGVPRRVLGSGVTAAASGTGVVAAAGIRHLAYAHSQRFLLTAGFDRVIRVYNPFVNTLILTLRGERLSGHDTALMTCTHTHTHLFIPNPGHADAIVGLLLPPDSPQVISADAGGVIRIWDVRSFMTGMAGVATGSAPSNNNTAAPLLLLLL